MIPLDEILECLCQGAVHIYSGEPTDATKRKALFNIMNAARERLIKQQQLLDNYWQIIKALQEGVLGGERKTPPENADQKQV